MQCSYNKMTKFWFLHEYRLKSVFESFHTEIFTLYYRYFFQWLFQDKYHVFPRMHNRLQYVYNLKCQTLSFDILVMDLFAMHVDSHIYRIYMLFLTYISHDRTSCAQVQGLPQSHFRDNRESILFSWLYIYITPILLLWD